MEKGRGSRPERYRKPGPQRRPREYEEEYEPRPQRRPPPRPYPARRRRRAWPILLAGCGIGILVTVLAAAVVVFLAVRSSQNNGLINSLPIIGSPQTFAKSDTTQIPISAISQMQICDKIGNVSIKVDQTASLVTMVTKKIVHVNSQTSANQEFQHIAVEVQPPNTITNPLTCARSQATATVAVPTTPATPATTPITPATTPVVAGTDSGVLIVNVTLPDSTGLLQANADAVDISIILPPGVLPTSGPTMLLNIEDPVGNINIDGLQGILNIKGSNGNVTINNAILASGSQIATTQGNITFNGHLAAPADSSVSGNYHLTSEQGTIDITLLEPINVILDLNINVGKIISDFSIAPQSSDGGVTYHGPLNTTAMPISTSTLLVDVSSGTVNLHKMQ